MGIKKGYAQVPFTIVPIVITAIYMHYVGKKFGEPSKTLALNVARMVDTEHGALEKDGKNISSYADLWNESPYAQPSLKKNDWETAPRPYRELSVVDTSVEEAPKQA